MDKIGNYKKKWQWYFIKGHVHTPPFQPICLSLNKELSCRVMEQVRLELNRIIVSHSNQLSLKKIHSLQVVTWTVFCGKFCIGHHDSALNNPNSVASYILELFCCLMHRGIVLNKSCQKHEQFSSFKNHILYHFSSMFQQHKKLYVFSPKRTL